jgi:hypothetical protein
MANAPTNKPKERKSETATTKALKSHYYSSAFETAASDTSLLVRYLYNQTLLPWCMQVTSSGTVN